MEEPQESQDVAESQTTAAPGTPPRFVWSPELTAAFISLRSTHEELFTKRRNSASHGYSIILQKLAESGLVEDNILTPRQLRKKWENLLKRYRKLKLAANCSGYTDLPYETWPHFKDMDQIFAKHEPLTHMLLSEPISNDGFDYNDDYIVSAKRFRPSPDPLLVESSTQTLKPESPSLNSQDQERDPLEDPEQEDHARMSLPSCSHSKAACDHQLVAPRRSEILQQLLVLHERFISIYERLVIALENSSD